MPKLPRISGSDCISVLKRLGFAQVRQRGSHVILRRGQQGCVVPMHREMKVGTLAGVLRARLKNQIHCMSRREEAQISGDLAKSQSLLTSAPTVLRHVLRQAGVGADEFLKAWQG